jgi:hypothetical protein
MSENNGEERISDLEERIRDAEVARGERPPVPEDPTDLPHSAPEYYQRMVEHIEGEEHHPYAEERWEALESKRQSMIFG